MNLDLNNHLYPHFTEKKWGNCGILQGGSVELFHTPRPSPLHNRRRQKAFRQQKRRLADILQAKPCLPLTTRTTASSQPAATRSFLLSINNPNTNPRMKKKEKLKPYMIPIYETILYFCSAFEKQVQTNYQERYINTYLLNL